MESNSTLDKQKRKRGRPRGPSILDDSMAAAYGISVPVLGDGTERFLSPNDIGKLLNITGEAVKQWIYRRKLPAVKLANGYWKVKVTDFEGFLKARVEVARRHILITDGGNSGAQEIIAAALGVGYQPVVAHNYSDALLKALDHFPAMFIICVSDADPECWKFAQRLRTHKSLRSFPILFIGGESISDEQTDNAVQYCAQGILTRPLKLETVQSEIDRILKRAM